MKLKKNELVKAVVGIMDERNDNEMYMPKTVYFTQGEAKQLRRNSKNLHYWDGCNWKHENIKNIVIVEYAGCEVQPVPISPAYTSYWNIEIDGKVVELFSSNMSRHLTPYWEEESEY